MSSFASLLAQSKAQTQVRNAEVQSTLAQRQERERREQEESERKHREELARRARQRQVQAEAEKREAERAKQREMEQHAKEQERERKKKAEMDKLLGKKREEREREPFGGSGSRPGGSGSGSGSPRKKRSRSSSPSGGGGGPVLTRMERRALKTDPNARPAWASSLVGERGPHSGSPAPHPKHTSGIRAKKSSQSPGMKNANGYGEAIKLSRKETGSVADYLEEKRQRELAGGKSKSYLNINGGASRAVSTGPLPNKAKANGLKPKSAPSSIAGHKRRRSDEEDEDSMFDSAESDDDDVPPSKRRAVGGSVLARFGLQINQRGYHNYDDDDLSDMEAGYDEVERENERAYVVLFPSWPVRGCWGTDYNFWPQFTRGEAGGPDRLGRRNAARRGETEAEDGKGSCWWSCLSMLCRFAFYYLNILLDTDNSWLMFRSL